jgi:hypothetical protein
MKLAIKSCPICAKSGVRAMQTVSVEDEGIYISECKEGHRFAFAHQLLKFYLLFEIGAHAIADGYYREAVVSFCSSLERFYELYFRTVCLKHAISHRPLPGETDIEELKNAWRQIAQSSERQFGAFVAAYFIENGSAPKPILTSNLPFKVKNQNGRLETKQFQSFRNDVVHNGYIPNRTQAMQLGHMVLDFISTSNIRGDLLDRMEHIGAELQYQALERLITEGRIDKDATYAIATSTIMMGSVKGGYPHVLERYVAALERNRST